MALKEKTEIDQALEAIHFCRSIVVDTVEMELGEEPHWAAIRSRLLRAFGEKGLSGRLIEILAKNSDEVAGVQ